MTMGQAIVFAGAMALWAAIPGPGLAAVVSRTLGSGPRAGFAVIAGLVVADAIYMAVAVAGLVSIATAMGPLFGIVKYAAAAYLIWRGCRLFLGKGAPVGVAMGATGTGWRDIGFGALITLGNPKAILFFGAVVPTFFEMPTIGIGDFVVLIAIVGSTSFLVYGGYIGLTDRVRRFVTSTRAVRRLRQATGSMLIVSGVAVATR